MTLNRIVVSVFFFTPFFLLSYAHANENAPPLSALDELEQQVQKDLHRQPAERQPARRPLILNRQPVDPNVNNRENQNNAVIKPGYFGFLVVNRQDGGDGVQVIDVIPKGPAALAGLQRGDVVTAANNRGITNAADFAAIARTQAAGSIVRLLILRNGRATQTQLRLQARPEQPTRRFPEFGQQPEANRQPQNQTATLARITQLEKQNAALEQRIERLERLVFSMLKQNNTQPNPKNSPPGVLPSP